MRGVAVPEEIRIRLLHWCTERIPAGERRDRQIGYTIAGDEVTIIDRHAPTYPELSSSWTTTPVARLRAGDPEPGSWSLYRPSGESGWARVASGADPLELLAQVSHD